MEMGMTTVVHLEGLLWTSTFATGINKITEYRGFGSDILSTNTIQNLQSTFYHHHHHHHHHHHNYHHRTSKALESSRDLFFDDATTVNTENQTIYTDLMADTAGKLSTDDRNNF